MKRLPSVLALVAALALPALTATTVTAEDKPTTTATKAELGKKAPAIVMQDSEGRSFELHDNAVSKKDAAAVVMAQAKKFGAAKDATAKTKIADLKGMKDEDGDLDASKVRDLAVACGQYFGLVATEESVEGLKTLGDLTDWVAGANGAPIILMTWSPRCPSVKRANDKIIEMAAKSRVRIFAIGCNTRDTDEAYAKYMESFDFPVRVFWDREQRVTDILGGKTTPHFFLFDKDGVLQYRGAMDNDPMGFMDAEDRKDYILDAVGAIRGGKEVQMKETEPSG